MKTVMKFLSLLLCFELIIGPVQGSLFLPSQAIAGECGAGQAWNSSTGRCNVTADTLNTNISVDNCNGNQACLEKIAKDKAAADTENPFGERGGNAGTTVAAAVGIGIPLLIVITILAKKPKGVKCRPASLLLMYAAGAALAVGEIYGFFHHKAKLDEIQAKWDKDVVKKATTNADKKKSNATEAQSQAFEYLAQNEDQVANTAKTKKGFYLAATGLFAAGAVAAVVEQVQLTKAKAVIATPMPNDPTYPQRAMDARTKIQKLTCNSDADTNAEIKPYEAPKTTTPTAPPQAPQVENITIDPNQADTRPLTTEPLTNETEIVLPAGSGGSHWNWQAPRFESPTKGAATDPRFAKYLPKAELKKLKQVAAYNLSTAQDAEQLLQLMNEMNAIELENYTKVSYLEEDQFQDLKKIPLSSEVSKVIADAFISSAYADATGCSAADTAAADAAAEEAAAAEPEKTDVLGKVIGIAGTALPLVLGLKSILGGVKSEGGVPISAETLNSKVSTTEGKFVKFLLKPSTRIAINGVLGGWMGTMAAFMQNRKEEAEARAKKLREMKEEFVSANGLIGCKEEDRSNSCKPICYCYTPDNKRNPDRAKDKVCTNTYANLQYDPYGNNGNDRICLDQNNRLDAQCACRAKKSCMKITSRLNMSGFKPGTFKMINAGIGPVQDLFNGNVGAGNISDSAGINAAKIRNAADAMLAKVDPKAFKEKNRLMAGMSKALLASGSGMSMGGSGRGALPSSPAGAAAALDKELKDHKKEKAAAASNPGVVGAGFSGEDEEPDITMTEDAGGEDIEIADVMGKEMDLGNNDVHTGSHTNIFEVLSNRYQRSGMRRLLDPGSAVPADAPAETELAD